MTCMFVKPLDFTVNASSATSSTNPASNTALDPHGLTWRTVNLSASPQTTQITIDLGANAVAYDTVALIGHNLVAADQWQVQTSTGSAFSSVALNGAVQVAYTGTKPDGFSGKSIYRAPSTRTERYVRITMYPTGKIGTYQEIQRIVIGKAVTHIGIDTDAEFTMLDGSVINSFNGGETVEEYPSRPQWKVNCSMVNRADWNASWSPFFAAAGTKKAVLFVPEVDDATYWQSEAVFGRMTAPAKGTYIGSDKMGFEVQVTALAL